MSSNPFNHVVRGFSIIELLVCVGMVASITTVIATIQQQLYMNTKKTMEIHKSATQLANSLESGLVDSYANQNSVLGSITVNSIVLAKENHLFVIDTLD